MSARTPAALALLLLAACGGGKADEKPSLAGTFDLHVTAPLGTSLPEPYESLVAGTTTWLASPHGLLAWEILRDVDTGQGSTFVGAATLAEVTAAPSSYPVWSALAAALDSSAGSRLGGGWTQILGMAGSVRPIVSTIDARVRLTVSGEPAAGPHAVTESWTAFWVTAHEGCAVGDLACARRPLDGGTYVVPAPSHFSGTAAASGADFNLTADPRILPVDVGLLLVAALHEVVYPLACGAGCGDLGALLATAFPCASVGAIVSSTVNGLVGSSLLSASQGAAACVAGSTAAADRAAQAGADATSGTGPDLSTAAGTPVPGEWVTFTPAAGGRFAPTAWTSALEWSGGSPPLPAIAAAATGAACSIATCGP